MSHAAPAAHMTATHRSFASLLQDADSTRAASSYFTQSFYHMTILPLLLLTLVLSFLARPSQVESPPEGFGRFQALYFCVWSLCVAADWLQGPYVYALYQAYGFPEPVVAQLFVAGFAASLLFSCFVGSVADRFGRKRCCMAYCCFYIVSCMTKHFNSYWVLMVGRITGGIATSLLFSCFECWMVSEHLHRHQFSSRLLSYVFGVKFQLMYFVAIVSGIVAQFAADSFTFGPVAKDSMIYTGGNCVPFDLAAAVLVPALLFIGTLWDENYGSPADAGHGGIVANLKEAMGMLFRNANSFMLCVVLSCFEGSMYVFVFHWTPALETSTVKPPFGIVFALFMMACMCGASVSTLASGKVGAPGRLQLIFAASILAFAVASKTATVASRLHGCFLAFLVFEFCVGVYFPSIGILKSEIVPEHIRGTMYNLYRVPLNVIVLSLLLTNISVFVCFNICAGLIFASLMASLNFARPTTPPETMKNV